MGTASIEVKNGTVGSIYGGGAGGTDDIGYSTVETSAIRVSGGTVNGEIYGGGTEGDVTTSATVTITGGTITNDIYGGGYGEATVKTAEVVVSGEAVTFTEGKINIYGGGNGSGEGFSGSTNTVGSASVSLNGVNQGDAMVYVYGGGVYGTQQVTESMVTVTDSSVCAVYGGTASGYGAVETAEVVIDGSRVSSDVYGGGAMATATTGSSSVKLTGGSVVSGDVYGGGFSGGVTGDVAIHISGATVNGDVNLGAWSGDATVGGSATLTISGGNNTLEGVTANGIAGGATIDVQDGTQIAGVTSDGALTLTGNGVYTSGITAEKLTADALTFEVTKEELANGTLINLTGSDSALGAVTVKVTDSDLSGFNGVTLISGDPGQDFSLTLTDGTSSATIETAADTVLANSNWADYAAGSVVLYNGKFYQIGTNAFGSITDAAATDVSTKILVVDGTWNGDQYFNGHVVEIGTADTAVKFDNYVFGGALNENTGDVNLDYVNGDVSRIYGAAVNAEGDYTAGNITLNIGEDVTVSGRMAAAKMEAGNLTTGDVEINYAGKSAPDSGVALFGGAQVWYEGSATHESVTLNISGELTDVVYAAGQANHGGWVTVKNGVTTNVTGGSIGTDGLMGGGFSRSDTSETDTAGGITIEGGTWINISGGEITDVYGGTHTYSASGRLKSVSNITGGTHINMTGGTVGNVQGGGYTAWGSEATIDSTEVKVSGGTVLGDVQGGSYVVGGGKDKDSGNSSTITGDVSVVISGDADIQGSVYGGSWVNWATGTAASYIEGVSKVVVEGGQIAGNVAGGGVTYANSGDGTISTLISESGSTEVTLTGGTIKGSVIGGGVAIDGYNKGVTLTNSVSNTSVVIDGATVEGSVIAGGYAEGVNTTTSVTGGVAVEIKSGTIMKDVYGGSIAGNIGGDSTISISGGDILRGVYGADVTGTITGNSTLSFDNAGDYTTSITVISGFDDVSFNGGTVNFTNVTFQDTVISVSDAAPVQGETYTFATGAMSFGDGTQFRFGDALYTLGVAGEDGFVFDYNAETGLVADLANLDTTTFAVNSDWSTLADRTVVELNGDSYTVGINAFGTFADAISGFGTNATANQATSQIIFGSDNTSGVSGTKYYLYTDTDLALTTDGTPRTVTINGDRLYLMNVYALDSEFKPIPNDDLPTVTIGEGLTLVTGGLLNVGQNVDQTDVADGKPTRDPAAMKLVVDGTLVTRLYVASNSEVVVSETGRILMGAKESFITRTGAQMTVNGDGTKDEVQFEVNYTSMQGGVLTLNDTWMKSGVVWLNTSDQGFDNEPSTLVLNNSKLEGSQNSGIQSGSTITASNGSEMTFVGVVENAGTISLDASSLTAKGGVVNSGTMNFTDAVDANTITNSGTVNFSGESSFSGNAEGIDNSALIQVIDGTLTLDGGSFSNRGNIHVGDFADSTAAGSLKIVNGASVTTAGTIYIGTGTEMFGANASILELDSTAGEFKINNGIYIREDGKMLVNGHSGASFSNVNVGGEFEMIGANSVSTGISVGRNTANGGPAVFHMKDSTLTDNAALTFGYKLNRDAEVTLENSHIIENSTQEVAFGVEASGGYGIATVTMTGSSLKTPGAVSIGEGSSVTLQEASSLDAPEITNNGTLSFSGSSLTATKGTVINNGVLNAADSSLKITRSSNTGGALINNSGAELVLDNTAVFRSGSAATKYYGVWTLDNAGTIKLTNGSYLGAYTLTNSGSITLDYTSTLGLTNYSGAGSVTVDTTGYTGGAYKLFNDEQYTGTWTVEDYQTLLGEGNWRDDYYVIGGDLILTDADMTNFYVNTAWSDLEEYDVIAGHDKVYYGLNAYDIGSNAILNAINSGSDVTVHLESDAGVVSGGHLGVVWRLNNNTTTITADEARTLTLPIGQVTASGFYLEGNGNLVFDKNVTVHWTRKDGVGDQSLYFGSVAGSDTLPVMEVKGAMIVDQSFNIGEYQVDGKSDAAGELIIHEGASLSVGEQFVMRGNGAALDLKDGATASFNYATIYGGELNATGAILESKAFVSISWLPRSNGESYGTTFAMNLTDSTFTVGTNFSVTGGDSAYQAEVTLDGSELIVNGEFSSDRTVSLTNGSTLELKGLATNGGILNVNDSALNASELASTGEINVSGTSTLNIGTLTGEVDLLDGAVLTDSNVGGIVSTEGDVTIAGTTALGQLVLEGSRGDDRTIVINENANVTLNDQKDTDFGVLDVGIGLQKPSVTTGDTAPREYYGYVLVKGNLSVENYNASTGDGKSGAIYIRPYAELVVTGTLDVKGEVHNRGSLVVDGGTMTMSHWLTPKLLGYTTGDSMTVTNGGFMDIYDAGAITFGEASASQQHMEVAAQYADGMFATISNGGRFVADTLAFANDDDVTLRVTGADSLFKLYSSDGREATNAYNYAQNEGTIIVEDQAVFDVSGLANDNFANSGSFELAGGSAIFATLTNSGAIALDSASLITVQTGLSNTGTITIDMSEAGEFGVYKLIDYTGTGNLPDYGEVKLDTGAYETIVIDGDLYAFNVDTTTLKVNAAWNGMAAGTEVAEGYFYGFNAFDTFEDAYNAGTSAVTILVGSDLDNVTGELGLDAPYRSDIRISSDDGNEYTLTFKSPSADGLYAWNRGQKITIDKEITLTNMAQLMAVDADTLVTIDGNVTSMQLWAGFGGTVNINETATVTLTYGDGWLTLRGGGTVNVTGTVEDASALDITTAQAQFDLGYSSIGDARSSNSYAGSTNVFNMTNTFVDGGAWLNLGAATWDSGRNSVNMTNSVFKVNALNMYDDGKFNVNDGSCVIVNGALNVAEESVLTINEGSSVTAKIGTVSGTVNVDNGTLNIAGTVENSGAVNFSNATDANTIANSGTVNFKGGTEFQGEISGNGTVQYMGADNKLTGDVSAQKFIVGLEGADAIATALEISGGATVNMTGGGNSGRIGVNTDVVITGEGTTFTNNANLTMDESATLEISDGAEVTIGYLATGGKTDVTGATLNLTGGTGTAGASAIGGLNDATEFNVNDGGVVNAQNGLVIGHRETKDGLVNVNAGGTLNVSGGALKVSGLVGSYNKQGNGTLNVNGGTVTADNGGDNGLIVGDAWDGADGIVNVTNGGSIDAGYSIQLNSTSKVTIDGGSMSAEQMYQSEGGELSIVNGGNVTLSNSYFAMGGKITVGGDESGKTSVLETLAGAEKRPASLGGDYTGHDGETVLNIEKNGEVILGTGLIVGHRAEENVSKDATVNVNEGGKLQVADSLQLGSTGEYQAQGVVNVNGGELDASAADVTINNRGELNVNDGSFSAQSVTNNGAVVITGTSTVDTKFAAAGTGSVEIVDATLGVGTSINEVDKAEAQTYYNNIALKGTVTITDGAYLNSGWNGNLAMGFSTGMSSGVLNIANGAVVSVGGSLYFGTEEADGNFQLNVSGEGTSLQSNGNNGEFYIFSDAVVSVTNGASMMNNARIRSGATYVFGAVDDTVAATVQFRSFELVEGANVTIQGGATADLGILVFGDSYMDYDGSFTLAAGSLLKLSSYSSERNAAEITVSGIDDTFSGVRKLIDNTGSTVLDYSDMIANWGDINTSVKVVENDLYQVNVDMTTLLVDSGWSDLSVATEVKDGFFYRFNAFDNMSEAISVSADDTTINVASGTYAENVVVTGNRALELGAVKMNNLMLGSKDEAFTGTFDLESLLAVGNTSSISDGALILRNGEFTMTDFTADVIALGNNNFDTSDEDAVAGTTYRISSGEVVVNNLFYVGCADAEKTDRRNAYTLTVDGEGQLKIEHGTLNIRQDGVFNVNGANTDVNLSQFLVYGEANITDGAEVSAFNLQVYNDDDKVQLRVTDSTIKMQIDNLGGTVYIGDRNGSRSGSVSLENSTLDANILLLGSKTVGATQSQLSLSGESTLSVAKTFSITGSGVLTLAGASSVTALNGISNSGTITQDATSTITVTGDFVNNGTVTLDGTTTISGNYTSGDLTLNAGAAFTAGSITVDALTMALGSSLTLTGTGSTIESFTVTGDTLVDMTYRLVVSGWDINYADGLVVYKGETYTVRTDATALTGINFVLGADGSLYVKDFGATPEKVYIGTFDETWSGDAGSRSKVIDGVTYNEGYTAFESMEDAMTRYPEIGTTVTSVILVDETVADGFLLDVNNVVDTITVSALSGADEQNRTVSSIADGKVVTIGGDLKLTVDTGAELSGNGSIEVGGDVIVVNNGHLDTTLTSGGTLSLTNTSDYTLSGEYTAERIDLDNSGTTVDLTLTATTGDITVNNSGTMADTVLNTYNSVILTGDGVFTDVTVNASMLYLSGIDFTFSAGAVDTIHLSNADLEVAGGTLTLTGGTVGTVDGMNFGSTMWSGTVVFDGADLSATSLRDIQRLTLASGTSSFNESRMATYYMNELEIADGATLNWNWTSDDWRLYNIGTPTYDYDDSRIAVVDADGTFAFTQSGEYALENFDVSAFAGKVTVAGGSTLNLGDAESYFADGASVTLLDTTAKLNLNGYGATEVTTGMNFAGNGEIAVNADHSLTGDVSGFSGVYTLAADTTATFEKAAKLAETMTLNGEGTADFATRTTPATVQITSDELATNLVLNNNDATLVGGSYGTITTAADDGSISIIAGININAEAVDVNAVNISIDSALDYTGPALTVSGLANDFGSITVTSDTAEFKSPYTLIATDDGVGFGSELTFTVGTDSVALTIGGTAVRFNNFWIQAYVEDGDLKIANVPGDSGDILVNSDWPTTAGMQVDWLGVEHIIDRDASKTVDRALEIVASKSTGESSTITIVKADTYEISNIAMTGENGVSALVIQADSLETPNSLQPGDVNLLSEVIATDGTAAGTSLTLKNV